MVSWCMAHPWMTFFIVMWTLFVLDSIFVAIANVIISSKEHKKQAINIHEEET